MKMWIKALLHNLFYWSEHELDQVLSRRERAEFDETEEILHHSRDYLQHEIDIIRHARELEK